MKDKGVRILLNRRIILSVELHSPIQNHPPDFGAAPIFIILSGINILKYAKQWAMDCKLWTKQFLFSVLTLPGKGDMVPQ
jgi:hypothetical protein